MIGITLAFVLWVIGSVVVTVLVYDTTFARYEREEKPVPAALEPLVADRRAVTFSSGDNTLAGYVYGDGGDMLVVMAPGYHACVDDYLWQIQHFLGNGYGVFVFDTTGSCHSEGESAVGFSQAVWDLDSALTFAEKNGLFGYRRVALFGHSRGGYAVCCALAAHEVAAVISVAGVNSAMEGVMEPAAARVGFVAYGNYPFLWLYQAWLFDAETVSLSAADCIAQSDTPVLIVHGKNDDAVQLDGGSIYAHRAEIAAPQVDFLVWDTPQQDGHSDLLFDADGTENEALMTYICQFLEQNSKGK